MIPLTPQARERGETVQQVTLDQQDSVSQLRQFEQYTSLECDFSIRVITPENFKAGKVKQHIRKWETITSDKSILDALNGFQLRFHSLPPTRNKCNNVNTRGHVLRP
jgi:hypothetical protein